MPTHVSKLIHRGDWVLPTLLRLLTLAWVVQATCGAAMLCGVEDDPELGEAQVCHVIDAEEGEEDGFHAGTWYYDPEYRCWAFSGARRAMGGVLVDAEECGQETLAHGGKTEEVIPHERMGWLRSLRIWARRVWLGITFGPK